MAAVQPQIGDPFSHLAQRLAAGDADAETLVVRRFTVRLLGLARRHLAQRIQQKAPAEEVVQSAFKSFFRRLGNGDFDLESWDGLWSLLALITVRKCAARRAFFLTHRRDVRREVPLSVAAEREELSRIAASRNPRPDEAMALAELVEQLLGDFSEGEQQIIQLRLLGYGIAEICTQLGRADRTVRRVLARARNRALRLTSVYAEGDRPV